MRAGATLLFDSDPPAEEAETVLKASAFIDALRVPRNGKGAAKTATTDASAANKGCAGKRILLIDHQVSPASRSHCAGARLSCFAYPIQASDIFAHGHYLRLHRGLPLM